VRADAEAVKTKMSCSVTIPSSTPVTSECASLDECHRWSRATCTTMDTADAI
jgi:hypothetical protein